MTRYHIGKDGSPKKCFAKPGNCPLAGLDKHFDSLEEAQEYADKKNEKTFMKEETPSKFYYNYNDEYGSYMREALGETTFEEAIERSIKEVFGKDHGVSHFFYNSDDDTVSAKHTWPNGDATYIEWEYFKSLDKWYCNSSKPDLLNKVVNNFWWHGKDITKNNFEEY